MRAVTLFLSNLHRLAAFGAIALGVAHVTPAIAQTEVVLEVTAAKTVAPKGPTVRQQRWLNSTPEQRVYLAEAIGEDGARTFAKSKGWKPLMDGTKATLRQGFDQVYRSADDIVHVVEAKGGTGPLARSYGHLQGSAEWAVKAAERTVASAKASAAEKEAAKAVLESARSGRLRVHVVRTRHVLGEPTVALLENTVHAGDDAVRLAKSVIDDLAAKGKLARIATNSTDDVVRATATVSDDAARATGAAGNATGTVAKVARRASRVAIPVAITIDGGLRVSEGAAIERKFAEGGITEEQREVAHAKNAAGMVGGWGGAFGGAKLGAVGGGAAGSCVAPGPGTVIGGVAGTVAGGVGGYIGGEAAAEAAAEWTVTKVHETGATIRNGVSEGSNWTAQQSARVWNWVRGN